MQTLLERHPRLKLEHDYECGSHYTLLLKGLWVSETGELVLKSSQHMHKPQVSSLCSSASWQMNCFGTNGTNIVPCHISKTLFAATLWTLKWCVQYHISSPSESQMRTAEHILKSVFVGVSIAIHLLGTILGSIYYTVDNTDIFPKKQCLGSISLQQGLKKSTEGTLPGSIW